MLGLQGITSSHLQRKFKPLQEAISEVQSRDEISITSLQMMNYSQNRQQLPPGPAQLETYRPSYLTSNNTISQSLSFLAIPPFLGSGGSSVVGAVASPPPITFTGSELNKLHTNMQNSIEIPLGNIQQSPIMTGMENTFYDDEEAKGYATLGGTLLAPTAASSVSAIVRISGGSGSGSGGGGGGGSGSGGNYQQEYEEEDEFNQAFGLSKNRPLNNNLTKGSNIIYYKTLQAKHSIAANAATGTMITLTFGDEEETKAAKNAAKKNTLSRNNATAQTNSDEENEWLTQAQFIQTVTCEPCKEIFVIAKLRPTRCNKTLHRMFEACYLCDCIKYHACPICQNQLKSNQKAR